jgi:hypothetical protein
MHKHLKQEHKLKHWARMQYGLFLKGAVKPYFMFLCSNIYNLVLYLLLFIHRE